MGIRRSLIVGLVRFLKWVERPFVRLALWLNEDIIKKLMPAEHVVNGPEPWHLQVHDKEMYMRVANWGTLGFAESYMDHQWDCADIAEYLRRVLRERIYAIYYNPYNKFLNWLQFEYLSNVDQERSFEVAEKHFDLGNDLYEIMLDPCMQYTCGYWRTASDLAQAQKDKLDLIAKKLYLRPGMRVLDIGCGFGGLAKHLAENYAVTVVGVSISNEQLAYAKKLCERLDVDLRLLDYRKLDPKKEQFDRITCVGMFEHVGSRCYDEYFKKVANLLKDDGIFLLHTIGVNHWDFPRVEGFFDTYIFPNGILPYYRQITKFIEKRFIIEDWHNLGWDYSRTLRAWDENFEMGWPIIRDKYGDRFYRMWKFYLQFSIAMFESRRAQLWQIVLTKDGIEGGYYATR